MLNLFGLKKRGDGLKKSNIRRVIPKLRTADIILVHTKGKILSFMIRYLTKSYWNHTAIVFTSFDKTPEYKTVLVAEALGKSIVVHSIDKFLNTKKYDIGVKRVKWLTPADCERIRDFILYNVDMPYDLKRLIDGIIKVLFNKPVDWLYDTNSFVCTSYVQKSYYYSMDPKERERVVFLKEFAKEKDLEFVSPDEISKSKKCDWIYNER